MFFSPTNLYLMALLTRSSKEKYQQATETRAQPDIFHISFYNVEKIPNSLSEENTNEHREVIVVRFVWHFRQVVWRQTLIKTLKEESFGMWIFVYVLGNWATCINNYFWYGSDLYSFLINFVIVLYIVLDKWQYALHQLISVTVMRTQPCSFYY